MYLHIEWRQNPMSTSICKSYLYRIYFVSIFNGFIPLVNVQAVIYVLIVVLQVQELLFPSSPLYKLFGLSDLLLILLTNMQHVFHRVPRPGGIICTHFLRFYILVRINNFLMVRKIDRIMNMVEDFPLLPIWILYCLNILFINILKTQE